MINEIQPKIEFQNIVQCPFKYTQQQNTYIISTSVLFFGGRGNTDILVYTFMNKGFKNTL